MYDFPDIMNRWILAGNGHLVQSLFVASPNLRLWIAYLNLDLTFQQVRQVPIGKLIFDFHARAWEQLGYITPLLIFVATPR